VRLFEAEPELVAQSHAPPAGQVRRIGEGALLGIDRARSTEADSGELAGIERFRGALVEFAGHERQLPHDAIGTGRYIGRLGILEENPFQLIDDRYLDVRPAEIDA